MDTVAWKAWYKGGSTYCSTGHTWESLPDEGVLGVVVLLSDGTRRQASGDDLYWALPIDDHFTVCYGSHADVPARRYPYAQIKRGAWTSDDEWSRVRSEMVDWTG